MSAMDDREYLEELTYGVLTGDEESLLGKSADDDEYYYDPVLDRLVQKGRRYVSDPSEVPEGAEVQEGERGGYFYETEDADPADPSMEGGGPGSESPEGADGGGGEDEERRAATAWDDMDVQPIDELDEQYRSSLDTQWSQDLANEVLGTYGSAGEEYVYEALHQNGDYFEQFDSKEDLMEDVELFMELM